MEQKVKVSIITVVYNGADTIEQTIKSVKNQDYDDIEYIIIDGDSTDKTKEIIQTYRDEIDIFVSEKDEGLYDAMNKGILLASGELIGILNSDDLYTDTTISKVVKYYKNSNAEVIYGRAVWFDSSKRTSLYMCHDIEEMWCRMAVPHPTVFIKKDIYKKYGAFNTQYSIAADYDLILRLFSCGVRFGCLDETLTYFRRGGLSDQRQIQCLQEAREISLSYIKKCKEKEKWLPKIQETYIRRSFYVLIENEKEIVLGCMKQILQEKGKRNHLVIFGTGEWGQRCFQFLKGTDLQIDFWVDNHFAKCGKDLYSKRVKTPEELENYDGSILIATFKYAKDIESQLKMMNDEITSISLLDWARTSVDVWEESRSNIGGG